MKDAADLSVVETVKDRCRLCFQCVRECPAKAIRILDGQAEVIAERCIACGNCVRVCHQHAKVAVDLGAQVRRLLGSGQRVAALLAPSFPAEFPGLDHRVLAGMIQALGFALVCEVGFGADLVARQYRRLLARDGDRRYIATTCPAIVCHVEKYHPELVPFLAPVVSPMVALARALRRLHGPSLRAVFIGPCLAKRREAGSGHLQGEVDLAITFGELRALLAAAGIAGAAPVDFAPPRAGLGAIFPVERGLLQAAGLGEDLVANEVVSAGGRAAFAEAIREFTAGQPEVRLLEVLCCDGCIMGAGMTTRESRLNRRLQVGRYVEARLAELDRGAWEAELERLADLDLSRSFSPRDQRQTSPSRAELEAILARLGKHRPEDELNCGACGYETCVAHAVAIHEGFAESEMCLPYSVEQLRLTVAELNLSHQQLAQTQEALVQSEKLASMGQLAAGIAHEINNPLGVVLMYAHLLAEEAPPGAPGRGDLELIAAEADRCKKIVAGLLHFARQNRVVREPVEVEVLVRETLRALPVPENVALRIDCQLADPSAELDRDQIAQVLTNLAANACAAMPGGGELKVEISGDAEEVMLRVKDTGVGIPPENMEKIFHPFFTTKPLGQGTGLGLAITYGIVKMHRGNVTCQSNADPQAGPTGTTFTVVLPRRGEPGEALPDQPAAPES